METTLLFLLAHSPSTSHHPQPLPGPLCSTSLPFPLTHSISFHLFLALAERIKVLGQGLVFGSDAASFQVML